MDDIRIGRRRMLRGIAAGGIMLLAGTRRSAALQSLLGREHPDPRPDVDGSAVLDGDALAARPDLVELYDGVRRIPHIADGIGCSCGCAAAPHYRSLLSCFEDTMAMHCEICQTEGRMVIRLHAAGRTLEQIRAALDARFG